MNLVIALVLASAPALAFSPYDVPVTDDPTVAPSKNPTLQPTADPTVAPTFLAYKCEGETIFTKVDTTTNAPGPLECKQACSEVGLKMPCITSAAVNDQLRLQAQAEGSRFIWLGYTDVANEGNFVWEDGCTSEYTKWFTGRPNNSPLGIADYAYMSIPGAGYWDDWRARCETPGTCFCYCQNGCGYAS